MARNTAAAASNAAGSGRARALRRAGELFDCALVGRGVRDGAAAAGREALGEEALGDAA